MQRCHSQYSSLPHQGKWKTMSVGLIDKLMRHKTLDRRPIYNQHHRNLLKSLIYAFFTLQYVAEIVEVQVLLCSSSTVIQDSLTDTCLSYCFLNGRAEGKSLMRPKNTSCLSSNENFPFGTGAGESQESLRQQIKSKMKYANAIIFIRECLWQKAINFSPASWHFNICITCFSQKIIFCVFHLRWQSIIFFSIVPCYFSKLSLSEV